MREGSRPRGWTESACVAIATGFYLSYIPVRLFGGRVPVARRSWTGAGFVGTLLGAAALPLLPQDGPRLALVLALAVAGASWACGAAESALGCKDDSRIVLDEVVGYWTAVAWMPRSLPVLAAAFVLFRLLDSFKLPPYAWLERLPGGWGVVMDDVGAGLAANLLLRALPLS